MTRLGPGHGARLEKIRNAPNARSSLRGLSYIERGRRETKVEEDTEEEIKQEGTQEGEAKEDTGEE